MGGRVLYFPRALRDRLTGAARRAFPSECCGLIEGTAAEDGWCALALHEAANVAEDPSRSFLVDPSAQFALLHRLRGSGRSVIGCFHSHPGGQAAPSARDRAEAAEDGFLWLIAAGSPEADYLLAAFLFDARSRDFEPVALAPE